MTYHFYLTCSPKCSVKNTYKYFDNLLIVIYQACHIYWFQIFKYEHEPILTFLYSL